MCPAKTSCTLLLHLCSPACLGSVDGCVRDKLSRGNPGPLEAANSHGHLGKECGPGRGGRMLAVQ